MYNICLSSMLFILKISLLRLKSIDTGDDGIKTSCSVSAKTRGKMVLRMKRNLFAVLFVFVMSAGSIMAQSSFDLTNYGVRIDPDKRLIAVLATIEMATVRTPDGRDERVINTPLSDKNQLFRQQLLADTAGTPDELKRRITLFIQGHKRRNPGKDDAALLSPFISMAYSLSPAPDLSDPAITFDLPGQLLDVLDFAPLVREFYRKSALGTRIDDYVKSYREESESTLKPSAREMVRELLDYLKTRPRLMVTEQRVVETNKANSKKTTIRKLERRDYERRFFIVPERLTPQGTINFVNVRDDYYVVVPPDSDLSGSDVRRAYLQFVIDPIVLASSKDANAMRDWARSALETLRRSNSQISPDAFLAITRSLVAAVDIRQNEFELTSIATQQAREKIALMKTDEEKRAVSSELERLKKIAADEALLQLYDDYQRGAVLAFYFAEQLRGVEDSGFDIASSLKEMLASFEPAKESARIGSTAEARTRAAAEREARRQRGEAPSTLADNPITSRLIEIQKTIERREFAKAGDDLKKLLADHPADPRIYYNIGRVSGQLASAATNEEDEAKYLLEAKVAYSNALSSVGPTTDRALISLTFVALGKIYEHFGERDYAIRLYDEAIKLDDVSGGAYREAIASKQRLLKP